MSKSFSCVMTLNRETKGALRFEETDENGRPVPFETARIGQLYCRKTAFNGSGFPTTIKVTVES